MSDDLDWRYGYPERMKGKTKYSTNYKIIELRGKLQVERSIASRDWLLFFFAFVFLLVWLYGIFKM